MSANEKAREIAEAGLLLSHRVAELSAQYTWKSENIVRFFEHLEMTTQQKIEFLAKELANAYIAGEYGRALGKGD